MTQDISNARPGAGALTWIAGGTTFTRDDIVHYRGKQTTPLDEAACRFDLILTGPHATAAVPEELRSWLLPHVTRRMQYDFSDVSTSALCRAWADADERVLYIENPHPRLLFDPNRPHPEDVERDLREAFRIVRKAGDGTPSFAGVDAVRPITFGGFRYLREPASETEWAELIGLLESLAVRGSLVYRQTRDQLIEEVYRAKARRLATVDLATIPARDLASVRTLLVNCVHDTMNATMSPDGAIDRPRAPTDELPSIVSLGNRGDRNGESRPPDGGGLLPPRDVPTMEPALLRSFRRSLQLAFEIDDVDVDASLELNKPYLGAFEVQHIGRRLRELDTRGPVRHDCGHGFLEMRSGAVQSEFRRETIVGPRVEGELRAAGDGWPDTDTEHTRRFAERLATAIELLREWDYDLPPITPHRDPRYR